jgi:DNA (cytosine-5)-methyltransferase 1
VGRMIPVVDLFAGPGGLNEGFSRVGEDSSVPNPVFKTVASFEMNKHAHETLVLRTAYRILKRTGAVPESYYEFIRGERNWESFVSEKRVAAAVAVAEAEVHRVELGPETREQTKALIRKALETHGVPGRDWVLIGGPPCQAYSLAGRSRRTNDETFEDDKKHFLYREYLDIIAEFKPAIFVMENVKGLLSSTNAGTKMFDLILGDLEKPKIGLEYEIRSMVVSGSPDTLNPRDFIIHSEQYGVPQKRHRIILLGIRKDVVDRTNIRVLERSCAVTVEDAIGDLPALRSGIAPVREDSWDHWIQLRNQMEEFTGISADADKGTLSTGAPFQDYIPPSSPNTFRDWVLDSRIGGVTLHETRRHMVSDLFRYGYLAHKAIELDRAPTLNDLPLQLLPNHKNVADREIQTPFIDRFKVQLRNSPSSTIVSHIAKDGHYYIHYDPKQMRSLTVREAARLQTFPDNYFFRGARTDQYTQVGNAVPPLLAFQIATKVAEALGINLSEDPSLRLSLEAGKPVVLGSFQEIEQTNALAF